MNDKNLTPILNVAEAAAAWWAERLAPAFQDNGDRTEAGLFGGVLGGMLAERNRPDPEQVELFRQALAAEIRRKMAEHPSGMCGLHTDYHPDQVLADAAESAGINTSVFPWKTNTWVYPDHFVVSGGYQAQQVLAWASDDYEPVPCHQQRRDSADYTSLPGKCGQNRYHDGPCDWSVPSPLCSECGERADYFWHEGQTYDKSHAFSAAESSGSSSDE